MLFYFLQVIAKRTLKQFWEEYPRAEIPLRSWFAIASKADWKSPVDIRNQFGNSVDFVADNRVVFDIGGNKFQLIVHIAYEYKRILIKFIGTHSQYDKIDAGSI